MSRRAHVTICGDVQGVGFRYATARRARSLGLTGWVRNRHDGSVEAVFEGAEAKVQSVVGWCAQGPRGAEVRDVHVSWSEPAQGEPEFTVR